VAVDVAEFTGAGGLFNTKALWPRVSKSDLAARFTAWLTDATAHVADFAGETKDAATRMWVRYRAWDDVYQIRLGNPATINVDSRGGHGYTQGQIDAAKAERDAAFTAFEVLEEEEEIVVQVPRIGTAHTAIRFTF
jgi:hypothetical protein